MKKKSWFLGNINISKKSTNPEYNDEIITPTNEDIQNVCNLMKIDRYKKMLIDAFKNKTIKLDTSEWFKD